MGLIDFPFNYVRNSQVWNSIFRHGVPRDRRTRVMAIMSNVFLHLHPVAVRKSGIRLSFTWCMGGLTFFLYLAEVEEEGERSEEHTSELQSHVNLVCRLLLEKKTKVNHEWHRQCLKTREYYNPR